MSRVKARSIGEVIERMRALHVDVMVTRPHKAQGCEVVNFDPQIEFSEEAHKEMDLLMLDAFEILGRHEIVEVRKSVDESYRGFWYA